MAGELQDSSWASQYSLACGFGWHVGDRRTICVKNLSPFVGSIALGPVLVEFVEGIDPSMAPKLTTVKTAAVTIGGIKHQGTYYVQDSLLRVQSEHGTVATQIGGLPPEAIAKLLLSELVRGT
jgi:hypothetical protein